MKIEQISELIEEVRFNCDLAAYRQAGLYSICGLAMRLRDLYKWENELPPWEEGDNRQVMDWINQKEAHWEEISHLSYIPIHLNQEEISPFETDRINHILRHLSLCYGAGLGEGASPTFFLGQVEETKTLSGCPVIIVEKEYARDLATFPAFSKGNLIVIRKQVLSYYLWNELLFAKEENKKAFSECFKDYGIDSWDYTIIKKKLYDIIDKNVSTFIYHEIGEIKDKTIDIETFHFIVKKYQRTLIEYLIRSIRDLMADTNKDGRFFFFIENKQRSCLAFTMGLFDEFRKNIYKDIWFGFKNFISDGSWESFSSAVHKNRERGLKIYDKLMNILNNEHDESNFSITVDRVKTHILSDLRLT